MTSILPKSMVLPAVIFGAMVSGRTVERRHTEDDLRVEVNEVVEIALDEAKAMIDEWQLSGGEGVGGAEVWMRNGRRRERGRAARYRCRWEAKCEV